MSQTEPDRYSYRPIIGRPNYSWPEGRRLAIYLGVNYEVFDFNGGLGPQLAPSQTRPDVLNYAWRDYGNRVGAWRLFNLFDRLRLRTTALLNADVLDRCPGLAEACRDRGDEIAAHGGDNAHAQGGMFRPRERSLIEDVTERLSALGTRQQAGSAPGFRKAGTRPTCLRRPAAATCSTGRTTTSRQGLPPSMASFCRSLIRRSSTICPRSSSDGRKPTRSRA